jgi:site-specific recombinase XerD
MTPIRRGQVPAELSQLEPAGPSIIRQDPQQVLHHYILWHEAEGHSRKTEKDYTKTLLPFFRYLRSEHEIDDLCQLQVNHIRAWLVWLGNTPSYRHQPRSSKTIESYCRQVMAFLRWCMAEGVISHNPLERLNSVPQEWRQALCAAADSWA